MLALPDLLRHIYAVIEGTSSPSTNGIVPVMEDAQRSGRFSLSADPEQPSLLPGHVPAGEQSLINTGSSSARSTKQRSGGSTGRDAAGCSSARERRSADMTRSLGRADDSARASSTVAQQWLQLQSNSRGRAKTGSAAKSSTKSAAGPVESASAAGPLPSAGGRVLLAAVAGYEGEAAVGAIAHIMQQRGIGPHEALVAASQRHVALHVSICHLYAIGCPAHAGFYPIIWVILY